MVRPPPPAPAARCVALGASNLTRALATWVAAARVAAGGPVDCIIAAGNGRSFGARSRFLGRELPGILQSSVFDRLTGPRRGWGAVLDVGNDLLYGAEVDTVLSWVETCVTTLARHVEHLAIGGLPPVAQGTITPFRFELVRRVLVPSCRLGLEEAVAAACDLEDGLRALARKHGAAFVDMPGHYYGTDPIHVRARHRAELCARLLGTLPDEVRACPLRVGEAARVRLARPARESIWGVPRCGTPPQLRLRDGTTLTLD
ncbi:MAG: hypothetical protein ACO4CT_04150 [Planctomycetota bacterium]|jgi:hypothetical protein